MVIRDGKETPVKTRMALMSALLVVAVCVMSAVAQDAAPKGVALSGTLVCGKCILKQTEACKPMLQVKDGDKTVTYNVVNNDVLKAAKVNCCAAGVAVKVTGTVAQKEGKSVLTPTTVEVAK